MLGPWFKGILCAKFTGAQKMIQSIASREAAKYGAVWQFPAYHQSSPGAGFADIFMGVTQARRGQSVVDVGAGAGAGSKALRDRGLEVTGFDLTAEAWDQDCGIPLLTGTVWNGIPGAYQYAYCCDMMEHLPTEFVALTVVSILRAAPAAFLSISFNPDEFGPALLGKSLHLTVRPFLWWRDMLREVCQVEEARDLMGDGIFYVRRA